jgi:hypothetical protein
LRRLKAHHNTIVSPEAKAMQHCANTVTPARTDLSPVARLRLVEPTDKPLPVEKTEEPAPAAVPAGDVKHLSIEELAAAICAGHARAEGLHRMSVDEAQRTGLLLLEARRRVPHGSWGSWLKVNCPGISERSLQSYMRIARFAQRGPERPIGEAATHMESLRDALDRIVSRPWPHIRSAADSETPPDESRIPLSPDAKPSPWTAEILERYDALHKDLWAGLNSLSRQDAKILLVRLEDAFRAVRRLLTLRVNGPKKKKKTRLHWDPLPPVRIARIGQKLDQLADVLDAAGRYDVPIALYPADHAALPNVADGWRQHPVYAFVDALRGATAP